MNNPFNFFDRIFCINLPKDKRRKESISDEFIKLNILDRVDFIYANPPPANFKMGSFPYPAGEFGVNLSQMKAIVNSIGCRNVLIFEDDITFTDNAIITLKNSIDELPENWDVLYLGGRPLSKLTKYSNNLVRTGKFTQASSYALNGKHLIDFYNFFSNQISKPFPNCCYDNILNDFSLDKQSFGIYPQICYQTAGHSSIRNAHRDYISVTNMDWDKFKP